MTLVRFAVGWYVRCVVQLKAILAAFHGGVKGQGDVERQAAVPGLPVCHSQMVSFTTWQLVEQHSGLHHTMLFYRS